MNHMGNKRSLFDFSDATPLVGTRPRTATAMWPRPSSRHENPVKSGRHHNSVESESGVAGGDSIVVRGDEPSFIEVGTGKEVVLPDDFLVVQDVSGKALRVCDLYFLRNRGRIKGDANLSAQALSAVKRWYGDAVSIGKYSVDLPDGGWKRVAKINGIRYRREGELAGAYEHPYDPPVVLFRSTVAPAWRVVHPDGCIIDERGIVHP